MPTDLTGPPTPLGIGTYNVDADAPSGLGFNAAMGQIDSLIGLRALIASPTFTGTPAAPTPATADNSTKIATTAFVKAQGYAPIASPTFTGTPAAPTPATGDNSTTLATTAFVKAQGYVSSALTSFNGRTTPAAVPTTGDYTAAQVTNAADKSSASIQTFTGQVSAPAHPTPARVQGPSAGVTINPDLNIGAYSVGTITNAAAATIANPANGPTGNNSAVLVVELRNTSAGTATFSWGTAYAGGSPNTLPASVSAGSRVVSLFVWDPVDSIWRLMAVN